MIAHPVFDESPDTDLAPEPEWLAPCDRDRKEPMTWLHAAWEYEAKIAHLKHALKQAEAAREECLVLARSSGIESVDLGNGIVRMVVKPGTKTRVLDVERFKKAFPKAFKRVAVYSVRLADAEQEVGKAALADVCDVREGDERISMAFEDTVEIPVKEVSLP